MPKPLSEKQIAARKAASERMKAMHAKKKQQKEEVKLAETPSDIPTPVAEPVTTEQILMQTVLDLQRQMAELKAGNVIPQATGQIANGRIVGTTDKYIVDPANYPNPVERLSKEPKLQRFAFDMNYELDFKVTSTSYQTKDGVNMREPRFTLELYKVVMDENTGEPTNGRFVVGRAIFHEDPEAAIVIARENGIEVDDSNEKVFLDEMRYLRMRDWLLQLFYPSAPSKQSQRKEMVLGGKLVEFFEVNSENSTTPFPREFDQTRKF